MVLKALRPHATALQRSAQLNLAELIIGFSSNNGQGGFTLAPSVIAELARLGLGMNIDLYPPGRVSE